MNMLGVMPAKAGIQISLILLRHTFWTPAFAGVTMSFHTTSYAGMTTFAASCGELNPQRLKQKSTIEKQNYIMKKKY